MKMSDLLIQNATMVLPHTTVLGDLLIENGQITKIQPGGGIETSEGIHTVDATGLHLLPGIIDPQVHFRDPGQPEKRICTRVRALPPVEVSPHS
ncbi:MAG: hypothetical protein VXW14_02465 [Candidatus Thermoplasmatota archaeon]|nr:hypothetical protein [Candidatus Thermoplasmatota archaeon]